MGNRKCAGNKTVSITVLRPESTGWGALGAKLQAHCHLEFSAPDTQPSSGKSEGDAPGNRRAESSVLNAWLRYSNWD